MEEIYMGMSTICVRVNSEDKLNFEKFCKSVGLNTSTAVNIFIKTVLQNNEIPFKIKSDYPISDDVPNETTLKAMEEGHRIINDDSVKAFTNIDDFRKEFGI